MKRRWQATGRNPMFQITGSKEHHSFKATEVWVGNPAFDRSGAMLAQVSAASWITVLFFGNAQLSKAMIPKLSSYMPPITLSKNLIPTIIKKKHQRLLFPCKDMHLYLLFIKRNGGGLEKSWSNHLNWLKMTLLAINLLVPSQIKCTYDQYLNKTILWDNLPFNKQKVSHDRD